MSHGESTTTLMLWSHPLEVPYPISSIIKTDSIQSITGKYFAPIDLTNMFCLMPISTASHFQFVFASTGTL